MPRKLPMGRKSIPRTQKTKRYCKARGAVLVTAERALGNDQVFGDCRFWLSRSGWDLGWCVSNGAPGDVVLPLHTDRTWNSRDVKDSNREMGNNPLPSLGGRSTRTGEGLGPPPRQGPHSRRSSLAHIHRTNVLGG